MLLYPSRICLAVILIYSFAAEKLAASFLPLSLFRSLFQGHQQPGSHFANANCGAQSCAQVGILLPSRSSNGIAIYLARLSKACKQWPYPLDLAQPHPCSDDSNPNLRPGRWDTEPACQGFILDCPMVASMNISPKCWFCSEDGESLEVSTHASHFRRLSSNTAISRAYLGLANAVRLL